jgi:hypothetical protein
LGPKFYSAHKPSTTARGPTLFFFFPQRAPGQLPCGARPKTIVFNSLGGPSASLPGGSRMVVAKSSPLDQDFLAKLRGTRNRPSPIRRSRSRLLPSTDPSSPSKKKGGESEDVAEPGPRCGCTRGVGPESSA